MLRDTISTQTNTNFLDNIRASEATRMKNKHQIDFKTVHEATTVVKKVLALIVKPFLLPYVDQKIYHLL